MKSTYTPYKSNLFAQVARGDIDPPDRRSSGSYGQRKTSHCSALAQVIKSSQTEQELGALLRDRIIGPEEHDLAIRQIHIIRSRIMAANRSIVLKFEWTPERPESATVAKLCILEWRWRCLKAISRMLKQPIDFATNDFIAVPEIWSKSGDPVPLHYHVMLSIPEKALTWFGRGSNKLWQQVIKDFGLHGRLHIEDVASQQKLSSYDMKQADIDWVAQRILLPIDVANYRGR